MTKPRTSESAIRDHLAANLDLVEPGLSLINKEQMLPNDRGAKGFVDIFAKDAVGRLVIIEIKRSDAAARGAVQELAKYAALVRAKFLVREVEYRLMVLSTDWHELGVPFAEFAAATSYDVVGRVIDLEADGLPRATRPYPLPPLPRSRKILRRHHIWEFASEAAARAAIRTIAGRFQSYGVHDFVVVLVDPMAQPDGVTHILYVAQLEKTFDEYMALIRDRFSADEIEEFEGWIADMREESDRVGEAGDKAVDCAAAEGPQAGRMGQIGYQIAHPEKAGVWLDPATYGRAVVHRFGRFDDPHLSDERIIAELKGDGGGSSYRLDVTCPIASKPALAELKAGAREIFFFNATWRTALDDLIGLAETRGATSITVGAFNNDDIVRTLAGLRMGLTGFTPRFEVRIDIGVETEHLVGRIEWDGTLADADAIAAEFFNGRLDGDLMLHHFGEDCGINEDVMAALGLRYTIWRERGGEEERVRVRGSSIVQSRAPGLRPVVELASADGSPAATFARMLMTSDMGFIRNVEEGWEAAFVQAEDRCASYREDAMASKGLHWCGGLDRCDGCGRPFETARFMADAALPGGAWGCVCALCHIRLGCSLGIGRGQLYERGAGGWLQVAGGFPPGHDDEGAEDG